MPPAPSHDANSISLLAAILCTRQTSRFYIVKTMTPTPLKTIFTISTGEHCVTMWYLSERKAPLTNLPVGGQRIEPPPFISLPPSAAARPNDNASQITTPWHLHGRKKNILSYHYKKIPNHNPSRAPKYSGSADWPQARCYSKLMNNFKKQEGILAGGNARCVLFNKICQFDR